MKKIYLVLIGISLIATVVFAHMNRSSLGIVTDSITKLQWQDNYNDNDGNIKNINWVGAINYCENLQLDGEDWRLPNINELKSIIDRNKVGSAIVGNFQHTDVSGHYWSATSYKANPDFAWDVGFGYGSVYNYNKDYSLYVRCVRGGQ